MDEVVKSFQRVANLVTEITNASREQSSGIEQVTQAVSQMDEVTQQNAALVEEAAAAAESLEEQARGLVQAVGMFKLAARAAPPGLLLEQANIGGMDFAAAIEAHQQWRRRLLSYVIDSSSEQLDPDAVSCDDRCALGQWIYGSCRPAMGSDSRCENLRVSHADFHQCAGQIIREKLAGHKVEALNMIKGDFTRHSEETIRHIKEIRRVWAGGNGVPQQLPPSKSAGAARPARQAVLPAHLADDQDEWEEF
jgi:methyl-accepting chemotaxis protein